MATIDDKNSGDKTAVSLLGPSIKNIFHTEQWLGQVVTICGWVKTRRDSKAGISFIALSDGSCFASLQCVVPSTLPDYAETVLKITTGCALQVTGELVASQGKGQTLELQVTELEVLGWVDNPDTYPMSAKRHSMEHLREHAHLRVRTNVIGAVSRVRHGVAQAIHNYFSEQGFFWLSTPVITACDAEGAGELFRVTTMDLEDVPKNDAGNIDVRQDFFHKPAYLTCSGQMNAEAYAMGLGKVYTFGPTFRAEDSNTTRHLAEFWMVEPEMAFADLQDDMRLAEGLLKAVSDAVLADYADDLAFFAQWVDKDCIKRLEGLSRSDFATIEYTEAIERLQKSGKDFVFPVSWGMDLQTEHERYLTEELLGKPVTVINYPKDIKAFYMRQNDDGKTVAAMDVLLPGIGEIIGGSQREERYDVLQERITKLGLDASSYQWYLDLRRYGTAKHAGFGLGFERLVRYVTGIANIRDVAPFPRAPGLVDP